MRKKWTPWEHPELGTLFFLQMMAQGIWLVSLSRVLLAHGYPHLPAGAFATTAVAAFISPLWFGAMADRHVSPERLIRWLSYGNAALIALCGVAIHTHQPALLLLLCIQAYSLLAVPASSIANAVIFSRLRDSQKQFGPIRAMGTLGWMAGCWAVSACGVDSSPMAASLGAVTWLALAAFTLTLAPVPPPPGGRLSLRERMGWDALSLLHKHDHRVVFITAALLSIPLAAFYPFTPPHMRALGFTRTTALMSLGQITEIISMFTLAHMLERYRLKWIFAAGLIFSVLRFALCALNTAPWLFAGVILHGFSYALFFITAQIYLNERIEASWRGRAQALMSLMTSGVGNLLGYLGTGAWFQFCIGPQSGDWRLFWIAISGASLAVLVFFLIAYHGRFVGLRRNEPVSH